MGDDGEPPRDLPSNLGKREMSAREAFAPQSHKQYRVDEPTPGDQQPTADIIAHREQWDGVRQGLAGLHNLDWAPANLPGGIEPPISLDNMDWDNLPNFESINYRVNPNPSQGAWNDARQWLRKSRLVRQRERDRHDALAVPRADAIAAKRGWTLPEGPVFVLDAPRQRIQAPRPGRFRLPRRSGGGNDPYNRKLALRSFPRDRRHFGIAKTYARSGKRYGTGYGSARGRTGRRVIFAKRMRWNKSPRYKRMLAAIKRRRPGSRSRPSAKKVKRTFRRYKKTKTRRFRHGGKAMKAIAELRKFGARGRTFKKRVDRQTHEDSTSTLCIFSPTSDHTSGWGACPRYDDISDIHTHLLAMAPTYGQAAPAVDGQATMSMTKIHCTTEFTLINMGNNYTMCELTIIKPRRNRILAHASYNTISEYMLDANTIKVSFDLNGEYYQETKQANIAAPYNDPRVSLWDARSSIGKDYKIGKTLKFNLEPGDARTFKLTTKTSGRLFNIFNDAQQNNANYHEFKWQKIPILKLMGGFAADDTLVGNPVCRTYIRSTHKYTYTHFLKSTVPFTTWNANPEIALGAMVAPQIPGHLANIAVTLFPP